MIISASRRTDIPCLYGDWFVQRIKEGIVKVRNPKLYDKVREIHLIPELIQCYVLWTKYPASLLKHYAYLKDKEIPCYFQFTVNGYGTTLEPNIPPLETVLEAFKETSKTFRKDAVIWRYDPIIITPDTNVDYHIKQFTKIAEALKGFTSRCVCSFFDPYPHCERNPLLKDRVELSDADKCALLKKLKKIANANDIVLCTCAEPEVLEASGVENLPCVDRDLIYQLFGANVTKRKDQSQRDSCSCVRSIDIGEYNSCTMGCKYCYASRMSWLCVSNVTNNHVESPFMCGWESEDDICHTLTQ